MSQLQVQLPESLRRRAEALAQDDGVSLEQFIATALAEKVAVLDAETYLSGRAARGSREKLSVCWAKPPMSSLRRTIDFPPAMRAERRIDNVWGDHNLFCSCVPMHA